MSDDDPQVFVGHLGPHYPVSHINHPRKTQRKPPARPHPKSRPRTLSHIPPTRPHPRRPPTKSIRTSPPLAPPRHRRCPSRPRPPTCCHHRPPAPKVRGQRRRASTRHRRTQTKPSYHPSSAPRFGTHAGRPNRRPARPPVIVRTPKRKPISPKDTGILCRTLANLVDEYGHRCPSLKYQARQRRLLRSPYSY